MRVIRRAKPEELIWVNQQYDRVQFLHSDFYKELIAIAEVDEKRAGIGRLVPLSDTAMELGGILVLEDYRGYGLARAIVLYLLAQAGFRTLYCLPFARLENFYASMGFRPVSDLEMVTEKLLEKWNWCNSTYPETTLLLYRPAQV
ncbi:GNAT family N-acetyltransferase [Pontibacter vulgaris]|uniref:GNAT family N-acetyltransferase n=1 Tax=Pontibacter vulgaris TaxID=2905679 RepID=UPI001FA6C3F4|nr:GNAT family N-acetyltransferase [Pontibacter vulgaris]